MLELNLYERKQNVFIYSPTPSLPLHHYMDAHLKCQLLLQLLCENCTQMNLVT